MQDDLKLCNNKQLLTVTNKGCYFGVSSTDTSSIDPGRNKIKLSLSCSSISCPSLFVPQSLLCLISLIFN